MLPTFNKSTWILVIISTSTFIISALFCDLRPLSGDEAFSVFYAQQTLPELIACLKNDQNPPLYFIALHYWIKATGIDLFSIRILSVIFSTAALFVFGMLIKKIMSLRIAILSMLLLILSNAFLYYSHEVRCFSLLLLLTGCSSYCFYLLYEEQNKSKGLVVLFTIINLSLVFTHYLALFFIIVQGIYFIIPLKNLLRYKGITISYICFVVLFFPWYLIISQNVPVAGVFWLKSPTVDNYYYESVYLAGSKPIYFLLLIAATFTTLVLIKKTSFKSIIELPRWTSYFLLIGFLPGVLLFFTAQITPVFLMRYYLYSLFPMLVIIAIIIVELKNIKVQIGALVLVLSAFILNFTISPNKEENWKAIADYVSEQTKKSSATIIIDAEYKMRDFIYYYDRPVFEDYLHMDSIVRTKKMHPYSGVTSLPMLNKNDTIIVILSHNKNNEVLELLQKSYSVSTEFNPPNNRGSVTILSNPR